ncbi:MAG: nicotinate-nucleotide adenylyltransferase [Ignavibacteriae bacterium]|nr:nicotinate-nucleotide adenylyltransferase [Ignavibacteriota bacterium]
MAKVGIFGGTFDPIHFGHLITAQTILEKREYEKIIFVPSYISPHKIQYRYTDPNHRFKMTELAIKSNSKFEVSDFEISNDDISFTYNTLLEFSKSYDEMELIIGFDNLVTFDIWHKPYKILELAKLVVMKRTYDKEIKKVHKYFGEAEFVDTPTIEISSTEIRKKIYNKMNVDYYLPAPVIDYINEHRLYTTL